MISGPLDPDEPIHDRAKCSEYNKVILNVHFAKLYYYILYDGSSDKPGKLYTISASLLHGTARMFSLDRVPRQNEMYETKKVPGRTTQQ